MPTGLMVLTHSRMQCFRTCPRKHWLAYELGYRPAREPDYFRFGSMIHWALDESANGVADELICDGIRANYSEYPAWCANDEQRMDWQVECETALQLFSGYRWRWSEDSAHIVRSEYVFRLLVRNPSRGGRASPGVRLMGKIDKEIAIGTEVGIREHKTTSDSLDADSDYWRILKRDQQIGLYLSAARAGGCDARWIQYDVIRKPAIRPKLVKGDRETPTQFGERLAADIKERPHFYFARVQVPRIEADLHNLAEDIFATYKMMSFCVSTGHHPRNAQRDTCGFCAYDGICDMADADLVAGAPDGFVAVDNIHPELGANNANSTDQAAV